MLCEEKERQQEKLCELKREILLKEREKQLDDALDKQVGFITIYASPIFKQACLRSSPLSREDFSASVVCWGTILCILNNINICFLLWPVMLSSNLSKCFCPFVGCPLWMGRKEKLELLGKRQQ